MMSRVCALLAAIALLGLGVGSPVSAGYTITTQVDVIPEGYRYTWSVYNVDQGSTPSVDYAGLDGFIVAVPASMPILSHTVPPPGISQDEPVSSQDPGPNNHWSYDETYGPYYAGQDGSMIWGTPPSSKKWIVWWGNGWHSIYPTDSTATFSITTDRSTTPGTTECAGTSFWLSRYPHLYTTLYDTATGPVVPEPSSIVALAGGLIALVGIRQRQVRQ